MKSFVRACILAAAATAASTANATVNVSAVAGGATYTGPTPTYDFNSPATTPNHSGGAVVGPGTNPFHFAQPLGSVGTYFSVGPSTSTPGTILFGTTGIASMSFLWGSIDTYNSITFTDILGNPLVGSQYTWTGSQIAALIPAFAQGMQADPTNNPIVTFLFGGADQTLIGGFQMNSLQNAFEIDNIALTGTSVPEPATWAMMLLGLGAIGFTIRRRKNAQALTQLA